MTRIDQIWFKSRFCAFPIENNFSRCRDTNILPNVLTVEISECLQVGQYVVRYEFNSNLNLFNPQLTISEIKMVNYICTKYFLLVFINVTIT